MKVPSKALGNQNADRLEVLQGFQRGFSTCRVYGLESPDSPLDLAFQTLILLRIPLKTRPGPEAKAHLLSSTSKS